MSDTGVQIVLCTFPDAETARHIGTVLVERQLAKCVNIVPSVESIYEWEGKVEVGHEVLAVFKVASSGYAALGVALAERHPYKVPEILAVDVAAGSDRYLDWVTRGKT